MRYRIEYADGRYCNFVNGRAELLKWLKLLKQEEISDVRKIYKSGVSDVQYRKAGYSKAFFEAHREEITLHKAAKNAFQRMGMTKLPKVKELSEEYATVLEQKKSLYAQYRLAREEMREYQKALHNTEVFFDMDRIGERDNRTQSEVEQKNQPAK